MASISRALLPAAAVACAGVLAAPAAAEERALSKLTAAVTKISTPSTSTIAAADAVRRSCTARLLTGRSGVVTRTFTAPADGVVTVRLAGRSGDWDIALFDRVSGRRVASSAAFAANEVAQTGMADGARVVIQACRRKGDSKRVRLSTQFARVDQSKMHRVTGTVSLVEVKTGIEGIEVLEAAGLDVTHDVGPGYARVVLYGDQDVRALRRLGFHHETVIGDLVARHRRARAAERAAAADLVESDLPSGRETYRTYAEIQQELKAMVEQHPDLAQPIALETKSFQGRDIQVVEIARNVRTDDDSRPVFTLGAVHHAREWPAAEATMEFAWDLLRNADRNPRLAEVLKKVRVVIMPLTNPDGYVLSRADAIEPRTGNPVGLYSLATGVALMGGTQAYKRKNCNPLFVPSNAVPCEFAIGVDPNRNYATKWGGPGSSTNPNDQSYRGPGPHSEPETRAVVELTSKINSPVHLSMHNVAAKVLRPPGVRADGFAPDEEAMKELGHLVAEPVGYANEYGFQLYDTTATTKDWGYDATGQYSYTVEMGPKGGDFHGKYAVHVIDQYVGDGDEMLGLRESLIRAALYTRRKDQTSRLTGEATPGSVLRIQKRFKTETYEVCTTASFNPLNVPDPTGLENCGMPGEKMLVDDEVDVSMTVGESGEFEWWVNPSTRPFYLDQPEAYRLTCTPRDGEAVTQQVFVARGQTLQLDLKGC